MALYLEQGWNIDGKAHFGTVLSQFVGPGKPVSYSDFAALISADRKEVSNWAAGYNTPRFENILKMMAQLPPLFTDMLIRPAGLAGVHRVDGDICPSEALREIAEATAALAEAWADQRIDHTELPKLRKELGEGLSAIAKLLAQLA